jgi:sulfite dehydrogenase (quinone) subunit SoeC
MHPARSVIIFTVLSGMGFGLLGLLDAGVVRPQGIGGFLAFSVAYGLALVGLAASSLHLGRPERALRAFTQWRTSWLSREAWAACGALLASAPVALGAMGGQAPGLWGLVAAGLCLLTIICTGMIYAQLATVPRWNHWTTPAVFVLFAFTGGAILAPLPWLAVVLSLALGGAVAATFRHGDGRFAARGSSLGTATGLAAIGTPRVFEQPHTGGNYLMREMIYGVGRKHAMKLRIIAVTALILPAPVLLSSAGPAAIAIAALCHLLGALVARWLFFAEAEHVVGLYYGKP